MTDFVSRHLLTVLIFLPLVGGLVLILVPKSAERAGVIGSPASCRRRLSAPTSGGRSSSMVSTA